MINFDKDLIYLLCNFKITYLIKFGGGLLSHYLVIAFCLLILLKSDFQFFPEEDRFSNLQSKNILGNEKALKQDLNVLYISQYNFFKNKY